MGVGRHSRAAWRCDGIPKWLTGLLSPQSHYPEDWMTVGLRREGFTGCPPLSVKEAPGDRFLIIVAFEQWGASLWVVFLLHPNVFRMNSPAQCDLPCDSGIFDPIPLSVGRHQPSLLVNVYDGHRSRMERPTAAAFYSKNVVLAGW